MALVAPRAGHKKKDKEVRQPLLPAEQISDLLKQPHVLSAIQRGSADGLNPT